jgi:hypothetical protein
MPAHPLDAQHERAPSLPGSRWSRAIALIRMYGSRDFRVGGTVRMRGLSPVGYKNLGLEQAKKMSVRKPWPRCDDERCVCIRAKQVPVIYLQCAYPS